MSARRDNRHEYSFVQAIEVLLFGVFVGWLVFTITRDETRRAEQNAAIKADVGRWVVDPATGASRFVYGVTSK